MTDRQRQWYEDKLAAFAASPGMRYELVTGVTFAAAACGLTVEDVIADCRARMPDFKAEHAANIRRGMASAFRKVQTQPRTGTHRREPPPPTFPDKVRELIAAGGMKANIEDLQAIGGQTVDGLTEREQTQRFLSALYQPADLLHVENSQCHEAARLGVHLRTRDEWLTELTTRPLAGDILGRNPYSGELHETGAGTPSLTASSCVAAFRYALIEFDALPVAEQCAFWLGFFRTMPKLAPFLVSLVWSGGKSIHGLLRVDADRLTAPKIAQTLRGLFCADTDAAYRADPMGFTLRGGTRLAGARRMGSGALQRLLYLR